MDKGYLLAASTSLISFNPDSVLFTDIYNTIGLLMLAIAVYAGLYLAIGKPFLPTQGPAWAIVFVWFCALVMGFAVDRVSIFYYSLLSVCCLHSLKPSTIHFA